MSQEVNDISAVIGLLQGGGNVALAVCCYFLWKAEKRLLAIEALLAARLKIEKDDDGT